MDEGSVSRDARARRGGSGGTRARWMGSAKSRGRVRVESNSKRGGVLLSVSMVVVDSEVTFGASGSLRVVALKRRSLRRLV